MSLISDALAILIPMLKRHEGLRLRAYPDPATGGEPYTIGWGYAQGVKPGDVWTLEQAEAMLRKTAAGFIAAALQKCPQLLFEPSNRAAACACLAYNIGIASFYASSVRKRTERREYKGAAEAFKLWNKANHRVMRGLTLRRIAEAKVYLGEGI